jgi:hypothetical protein
MLSMFHSLWFYPIGEQTHDLPHWGEHANHHTTDVVYNILMFGLQDKIKRVAESV